MGNVRKYRAEIVSVINQADNTYTVEFRSLSGQFKYLPGQFLHLALDEYDPSQGWPDSRCFSMQSSPSDEFLKITYSIKGSFTSRMAEQLVKGRVVYLKLPYGDFFQKVHSRNNVVFIAGGTGITPFMSLFNYPDFLSYHNPVLYYGIRNNALNIFGNDLHELQKKKTDFEIHTICQDISGVLNIELIFSENLDASSFFISGPQTMVVNFTEELISFGIPKSKVIVDNWE